MAENAATVAVIIAAHNAAATIGRAIASALAEPEVAEIIVVDDASNDDTVRAAERAGDDSGRLKIVRFETNRGPSAARNLALERSNSTLVAILDADDFILPGRFARLLRQEDWDLVADNIVFVLEDAVPEFTLAAVPDFKPEPQTLDFEAFVGGNISERGQKRGELGFLKPVIRRDFLDRHGLRYDEALRLGEDYDLYCRALLRGARFKLIHSCGYGAVQRAGSLSGQHRTADLDSLAGADARLLADPDLPQISRPVLERHEKALLRKVWLRRFLDTKRERGMAAALAYAVKDRERFLSIAEGVALDKWDAYQAQRRQAPEAPPVRYLLEGRVAA